VRHAEGHREIEGRPDEGKHRREFLVVELRNAQDEVGTLDCSDARRVQWSTGRSVRWIVADGISSRTWWKPQRLNGGRRQLVSVTCPSFRGGKPSMIWGSLNRVSSAMILLKSSITASPRSP